MYSDPTTHPSSFCFNSKSVRVIMIEGKPWFVARDVCDALTIPWRGDTLTNIKSDWKGMRKLRTLEQNQQVRIISEPAVYKLAFRSNKPAAEEFTNWVASEVLPALRAHGQYTVPAKTPARVAHTLRYEEDMQVTQEEASTAGKILMKWKEQMAVATGAAPDKGSEGLFWALGCLEIAFTNYVLDTLPARSRPGLETPIKVQMKALFAQVRKVSSIKNGKAKAVYAVDHMVGQALAPARLALASGDSW